MKKDKSNSEQFNNDELKNLAPELSQIKIENPFKVPEGYFDSLNADVMQRIEPLPNLESVNTKNPFKVPTGYFESLPTIIQQRIIDQKSKRISIREWISEALFRPVPKFSLAFASVALAVVFSVNYFTRTISVDYATPQLSETEQLDAAFLAQLDESSLVDALADEIPSSTQTQDTDLQDYLIDNDIDLTSITEQL